MVKDKKLLEAQRQFMRLCEWSYVPQTLEEDGEDENMPQDNGNMPQGGAPQGNDMPPMDDPNAMGDQNMVNDPNAMGDGMPQGDDMAQNMGGDMPQGDDMNGGVPPMDNMPPMEDEMMGGEDEEVIDVDQLTDAQEKMNSKVNTVGQNLGDVSSKIESLIGMLGKMEQMIDNNNQEIEKFKAEFEKRNPTQTEKLNLRSLDSYPFNVNPKDYWEEKGLDPNSNYSGESDNQKSTTQEYQITNHDVDDFNEREMEKSFDLSDDMQQDLRKIFGF